MSSSVWAPPALCLKYLFAFLKVSKEKQKKANPLCWDTNSWTQQSFSKVIFTPFLGTRKYFTWAQFVTGEDDETLTWPPAQSDLGRWQEAAVDCCNFLTWHRYGYPHRAGSQETGTLPQLGCWALAKRTYTVLGCSWVLQPASCAWSPHTRCSWWK